MSYQQYGYQPYGYQSYGYKQSNKRPASDGPQSDYKPSYTDSTKQYQQIVQDTNDKLNQQLKYKEYQKYQAEQEESDDDFRKQERVAKRKLDAIIEKIRLAQQKARETESFYSGNQYGNFFQRLSRVENRLYKFNSKYEIDQDKLNPLLYNY